MLSNKLPRFLYRYASGPQSVLAPRIYDSLFWKSASVRCFIVPHYAHAIPKYRDMVLKLYEEGKIHPQMDSTDFVGLEQVVDAIEHQLSGHNDGKVS